MCRRRKHNMMIAIMTVKNQTWLLVNEAQVQSWAQAALSQAEDLTQKSQEYVTVQDKEVGDKSRPLNSQRQSIWKGNTGVSAQYLLIALWLIYNRSYGTWHQQLLFKRCLRGLNTTWNSLWWLTRVTQIQAKQGSSSLEEWTLPGIS